MAKKTISEVAEEAQILADDLADIAGAVSPDPVPDIFKPNDVVSAVQLRQLAYKLRIQSAQLLDKAEFMEANPKAVEQYRPKIWRTYASLYLDAVEDQMDKGLGYCLRRMQEDSGKLGSTAASDAIGYIEAERSMAIEFDDISKEVGEMMD
jgi:hypothetical protein